MVIGRLFVKVYSSDEGEPSHLYQTGVEGSEHGYKHIHPTNVQLVDNLLSRPFLLDVVPSKHCCLSSSLVIFP